MLTATLNVRACKGCGKPFQQFKPLQCVCSPRCARKKVRVDKRAGKAADRAKRESLMPLPKLHRMTQLTFNRWVRLRDAKEPCISCGALPPKMEKLHAGRDAGHYRSVGSAAHLRYDEANVHAQCVHCNQFLAGNVIAYRAGLIAKIGLAEVERLEGDNRVHKWVRAELDTIKKTYRDRYGQQMRDLKKPKESA